VGPLAGHSYREVARKLRALGFSFDRSAKGSHEIWRHPDGRRTTMPRHAGDLAEGTRRAILRQAGLGLDEFTNA
jgi:predicted RNA binding protein YcfA (HicA-like mRNA interferase family)